MNSYEIEIEEDGGERRWVRASVGEACSLGELHDWMGAVFDLEPRGGYSFTLRGRSESDEASFRGPGEGHWHAAEESEVGGLGLAVGRRWIHRLVEVPFRDRELAVLAVHADSTHPGAPQELARGARGRSAEVDGERLAARVEQAANAWREDAEAERDASPESLRPRLATARDVCSWAGESFERWGLLEEIAGDDGLLWMVELPGQLSFADLHEEALAALELSSDITGPDQARGERLFVLQRAGRAAEARADAERWLADEPEHPWAVLFASDLFELLGESERARTGLARAKQLAADDLEVGAAVLERQVIGARKSGDEATAVRLERELEGVFAELEEREAAEQAGEDGFGEPGTGRNDACPCGSGMKFKRCCGAGGAAPRSDAAVGVELLSEIARDADQADPATRLSAALPRFAGEGFAGCSLTSALPLLPNDDLPEALVHWALLDCDLGDGTRVIERTQRRMRRVGEREQRLLDELSNSFPTLWRVEVRESEGRLLLIDQLNASAEPVEIPDEDGFENGAVLCARILQLDGAPAMGPGPVLLKGEQAEQWLAGVRTRLDELRNSDADSSWPTFLKRNAHELYRPLA